jgi:hypothetical protein
VSPSCDFAVFGCGIGDCAWALIDFASFCFVFSSLHLVCLSRFFFSFFISFCAWGFCSDDLFSFFFWSKVVTLRCAGSDESAQYSFFFFVFVVVT